MSLRIRRSDAFLDDLEEILFYIALDNPQAAESVLAAVEASIELLSKEPMIGSCRPFENTKLADTRMWPVTGYRNYLIFYLIEDEEMKLLRVINTARDFNLIFEL